MLEWFGIDWTSTDFANNVDELFNRKVLGAAFVTYAANNAINRFLDIFVASDVVYTVAWLLVFGASVLLFAYWGRLVG